MNIAAGIQQNLMAVQLPEILYANISARFDPCKEIGGDFYDVVAAEDHFYVVIADVSGKGVSAALLAQTLQGMVYAQLLANQPLVKIADALNKYICAKNVGKYATMIVIRVSNTGRLEYLNCGHVHPLLRTADRIQRLSGSNLPVGLIEEAIFHSHVVDMEPGSRLLLVTDGVTEAEDQAGDFFGNTRMEHAFGKSRNLDDLSESVAEFCGAAPSNDDRTMVEVLFQ
jgi:serine phosphatase RsbU (regulator of sigma subunit)